MTDLPVARFDLKPGAFPFTIEAISSATGEVVWREVVNGPGRTFVPPLAEMIGRSVAIRIRWADGSITETPAP